MKNCSYFKFILICLFSMTLASCNPQTEFENEKKDALNKISKLNNTNAVKTDEYKSAINSLNSAKDHYKKNKFKEAKSELNKFNTKIASVKLSDPDSTSDYSKNGHPKSKMKDNSAIHKIQTTYIIKSGDYIWKLAREYNLNPKTIISLNPNLLNPDIVKVGQKIILSK